MTPAERVAFVLHDVFRYTYPEIAEVVGRTPSACKQLAWSARRRIQQGSRTPVAPGIHREAVTAFKRAWRDGDLDGLLAVLDPAATAITDGGGIVSAVLTPINGAADIAEFFLAIRDRQPDIDIEDAVVNREHGIRARDGEGSILAVISFAVTGPACITSVWAVRNPQKLNTFR